VGLERWLVETLDGIGFELTEDETSSREAFLHAESV
jgi:hypothetical protein